MANASKLYYIKSYHRSHMSIWEGTLDYLENRVFGYTLECGNSWNPKIKRYPKTGASLVNALNQSALECNKYDDCYELSSKKEFDSADESCKRPMME